MWQWLCSDITLISKEVLDLAQNRSKIDKSEYLSLPRPGVSFESKSHLTPSPLDTIHHFILLSPEAWYNGKTIKTSAIRFGGAGKDCEDGTRDEGGNK